MEVGIIGLQGVGKTCLFRALTGGAVAPAAGGSMSPNVGMAVVPDPRLDTIASFITTRKVVPAQFRVVDIPGFATGGDAAGFARQVLAHIREVDALCHIVRCFGDEPRPIADIDSLETELVFADLAVAEPALDKAQRAARSGDADAKSRASALERALPVLNDGRAIRDIANELSEAEAAAIRGYGMLTAKPVLYIANISEDSIGKESEPASKVEQHAEEAQARAIRVAASLEAELAELDEPDRAEMLASLGLDEPAVGVTANGLYSLLGLMSFYTAGEKEVRAWPVQDGASAPEAAGVIHSDIQRGFIRAECYHVDDLVEWKTERAIKESGRLRSEGKNYHIRDGDVVHFLFNV